MICYTPDVGDLITVSWATKVEALGSTVPHCVTAREGSGEVDATIGQVIQHLSTYQPRLVSGPLPYRRRSAWSAC
jgi:hypothetical protein